MGRKKQKGQETNTGSSDEAEFWSENTSEVIRDDNFDVTSVVSDRATSLDENKPSGKALPTRYAKFGGN